MADYRHLIGKVVTFKDEIEECESYLEKGMKARIEGVKRDGDETLIFKFNMEPFEDWNKPLETSNYYDKDGNPTLTARQAGYYSAVEDYYLPNEQDLSRYFEVQNNDFANKLYEAYNAQKTEGQTYVDWLESMLEAAYEDGFEMATASSAKP